MPAPGPSLLSNPAALALIPALVAVTSSVPALIRAAPPCVAGHCGKSQEPSLMASVPEVIVTEPLAQYAYRVVQATRSHESVALGVSPRAAMSWVRAARARALLLGRPYVLPDDLKALAGPVLAHRVFLRGGEDATSLVNEVVAGVPVEL